MQLVRTFPGCFSYPELKSYACQACNEVVTLPAPDE
jgi:hypothetical protein